MTINFNPQLKPGKRLHEDGDARKKARGREEVLARLSKREVTQLLLDFINEVNSRLEVEPFIDGYFERLRRLDEVR